MTGQPILRIGVGGLPLFLVFLLAAAARGADEKPHKDSLPKNRPTTLVGMRGRMSEVILPGPELEVRPLEDSQAPFVLRIVNVDPHGTAFRYDFEYYALEPRTYDLTAYLRPKDGSAARKLPSLEVEVKGLLAPGVIHPHPLEAKQTSWIAGYRLILIAGGAAWVLGLLMIVLWGRRRNRASNLQAVKTSTVADRLRPLVVRAMTGMLTASQQAELERTLVAFWRQRLGLVKEKAPEALATLRSHPEAGPLLNQLELWLHRPGTGQDVDLGKLLWPYRQASAEELPTSPQPEEAVA
jgi:hypothetical protein